MALAAHWHRTSCATFGGPKNLCPWAGRHLHKAQAKRNRQASMWFGYDAPHGRVCATSSRGTALSTGMASVKVMLAAWQALSICHSTVLQWKGPLTARRLGSNSVLGTCRREGILVEPRQAYEPDRFQYSVPRMDLQRF